MLLELGTQVDILLRNGQWIRNMTVLSLLNNTVQVKSTLTQAQATFDTQKDVAVIVKSSLISI